MTGIVGVVITLLCQTMPVIADNIAQVWVQTSSLPVAFVGRWDFATAEFPPLNQVILFGGAPARPQDGWYNDTWIYSGSTSSWTNGPAAPAGLTPRGGATMAYLPEINKIVLFGGAGKNTWPASRQTWLFDGTVWSKGPIGPAAMGGRTGAGMAYMPELHKLVLFGGSGVVAYRDTWLFDGTTWTRGPATPPDMPARAFFGMTYDGSLQKIVVAGGSGGSDVWYFDGASWSPGPAMLAEMGARERTAMAYDPQLGGTVVHGGLGPFSSNNVAYLLKDGAWSMLSLGPTRPEARLDEGMVWNSVAQQLVVFAGIRDAQSGTEPLVDAWNIVAPPMTISPTTGPVGTVVTIDSGPGWRPGVPVRLMLDKTELAVVSADGAGYIHTTGTVVQGTPGHTKYFKLVDDPIQLVEKQPFDVIGHLGPMGPRVATGSAWPSSPSVLSGGGIMGPAVAPGLSSFAHTPTPAVGQISSSDGQFWLDGSPILLHGLNAAPFAGTPLVESDYQTMASWRMNVARLRIRWSALEPTPPTDNGDGTWTHYYDQSYLDDLKVQIGYASANGIYSLVWNYCGPPCFGNGWPDWLYEAPYNSHGIDYTDSTMAATDYWSDSLQQQFTRDMLSNLASELAGTAGLLGYELTGEPEEGTYSDSHATTQMILDVQLSLAGAVRGADPPRVIFFTTRGSVGQGLPNADLSGWEALGNVAFDVHDYFGGRWGGGLNQDPANPASGEILQDLFDFTMTPGVPPYLGTTYGQVRFCQAYLTYLQPLGIPLFLGEFGGQTDTEKNMMTLFGTMANGFNSLNLSWTAWGYNGENDVFRDDGRPQPWVSILRKAAAYRG